MVIKSFFHPAILLMDRLKYSHKMAFVGFFYLIPLVWFSNQMIHNAQSEVKQTRNLIQWVNYKNTLLKFVQNTQEHRGLVNAYLHGDLSFKSKISEKQKEIEAFIERMSLFSKDTARTRAFRKQSIALWNQLRNDFKRLSSRESWERHTQLIQSILSYIIRVGETSDFISVEEAENYELIAGVIFEFSIAYEYLGKLQGLGAGYLVKQDITEAEMRELVAISDVTKFALEQASKKLQIILMNWKSEEKKGLEQFRVETFLSISGALKLVDSTLFKPEAINFDALEYFENLTLSLVRGVEFLDRLNRELINIPLQKQLLENRRDIYILYSFIIITLFALFYFFGANYFSVMDALNSLVKTSKRISKNDFSSYFEVKTRDELSQVANSFNVMLTALTQSIEHRKIVEKALFESDELFRILSEESPAGVILYKEKIIYSNPTSEKITGFSKEELMLKRPDELIPQQFSKNQNKTASSNFIHDGNNEVLIKTKNGESRWLQISISIVEYKGEHAGLIHFTDITHQKEMLRELQASEKRYRAIIDTTAEGFWKLNEEGLTTEVNNSLCEMLGFTQREMLDRYRNDFMDLDNQKISEENREKIPTTLHRNYDITLRSKQGESIPTIFKSTTLFDDNQKFLGSFAFVTNITRRVLVEQELERKKNELEDINQTLEHRVDEEVAENREKDRLMFQQARYAQMGEMLSMIAHQWRQPLSAISTASIELSILGSFGGDDAESIQEIAAFIEGQTQNLSATINDFMDFFKPEKKETIFAPTLILEGINRIMSAQFKQQNIQFINELDSDLMIKGHKNELEQVIINLISNSKDAFEGASVDSKKIKVFVETTKVKLNIFVEDNALGIPDDVVERIFDPYFTTKEQGKGTGIGLYMSKIIVEKSLKGEISVEQLPKGTRFCIQLPYQIIQTSSDEDALRY